MALIKPYNNMSEQTYLSLYAVSPKSIAKSHISKVLENLQVQGNVRVSRYDGPSNNWAIFKEPWVGYPDYEVLGQMVPIQSAQALYKPEKFLLIDCIHGNPKDLRARVVDFVHKQFPEEVTRDFYLNNLSVNFGLHDVFEATENPNGTLFAHTYFSISIWGYRHPTSLAAFRETLLSSGIVKTAKNELSEILSQKVESVVYLA